MSGSYHSFRWLTGAAVFGALLSAGCSEPMDGIGGGKNSPVSVTILPVSGANSQGGSDTSAAAIEGYGHLKGTVTLVGSPPALGPLISESQVKKDDKEVCIVAKIPNEKLVVHGNAVQNVFIYLQRKPAGTKMPEKVAEEVLFDQKTCTFIPHAMVVLVGQEIRAVNSDPIPHNVETHPSRQGGQNFGVGASDKKGTTFKYVNAERTPALVKCTMHTWMTAWHLPLDHPYGAVTNAEGQFEIRDLPAGKHTFTVWHEGNTLRTVDVTIEPDGETELNLEIPVGEFKIAQQRGPKPRTVVLSIIP